MQRPTFFISSTIYDFADLRSSLKYFLEKQGCKVLASEYNDFTKGFDRHSYDECLKTIESADYFILLIGSRVGGWYDEAKKISITQKEYRKAYELHKNGKLKIASFVRSSVWQAKEDYRDLEKYLQSLAIEENLHRAITSRKSNFIEDAKFITSFINEVSRVEETKNAVKGEGAPPTGNWIHQFAIFSEIADVISGLLFSSSQIEDITNKSLLRCEIVSILKQCLYKKSNQRPFLPRHIVEDFQKDFPFYEKDLKKKKIDVPQNSLNPLLLLGFHISTIAFSPIIIPNILRSSTLLRFDLNTNTYKDTAVYRGLSDLYTLLNDLMKHKSSSSSIPFNYSPAVVGQNIGTVPMERNDILILLGNLNRWVNISELCTAIARYLDTGEYILPDLLPISPIKDTQADIDSSEPTDDEIDLFIKGGKR